MTDEITPRRLDELLDGELPQTDAERRMVELAARIESDVPGPSDALRDRVESISQGAAHSPPRRRWFARPQFAAALGAVLVALVAGTVVVTQESSNSTVAADSTGRTEASSRVQEKMSQPQSAATKSGLRLAEARDTRIPIPEDEIDGLLDALSTIADAHGGSIEIIDRFRMVTINAPPYARRLVASEVAAAVEHAQRSLPEPMSGRPQADGATAAPDSESWPLTLVLVAVP